MKWLVLLLSVLSFPVLAEDGCWIIDDGCIEWGTWEPVLPKPKDNTRLELTVPESSEIVLWGFKQPIVKGTEASFNMYINPSLKDGIVKTILLTATIKGEKKSYAKDVRLYPGQTNIFAFYYDDYTDKFWLFRNQDAYLLTIMKVPSTALVYIDGEIKTPKGSSRGYYSSEKWGETLKGRQLLVTWERISPEGKKKMYAWQGKFDFKIGTLYHFNIVYDETLDELIRKEPLRTAPPVKTTKKSQAK